MSFSPNGAFIIQRQIDQACQDGSRTTTITGTYEINRPIRIPSDFTLILNSCHLRMARNTFCNMFINASHGAESGTTIGGTDRNIAIEGVGRVILDGGEYNGLSERNSGKEGRPHISVNSLIFFTNVDGFTVRNLHLRNQRWWAMNFIFCRNGRIRDIDFCSDDTWVDTDGMRYHGLGMPGDASYKYDKIYIKNSDGVDIRRGCHDIVIENITGFTEDDTVAITGLDGVMERMYYVEGLCPDIYNIIVRNVNSSAYCANVRLLNQGGVKLYNILIDGVFDSSKDSPHMGRGSTAVRLGDVGLYGERHSTPDETKNITIRNVFSRAGCAMAVGGAMKNCLFENIRTFDECTTAIENNATVDVTDYIR